MSSDLELSDVWRELQRNGQVKEDSVLVHGCEKELVELMRQIDIMMRGKRIQWSNEKAVLNMRIESKERECALQQECIEKRDNEIGKLKEQVGSAEKSSRTALADYQQQVEQLRTDLTSLKQHYDRLKSKYNREKIKYSNERRDNESEIWSKDKKLLQQEVERLSAQMASLAEKYAQLESKKAGEGHPAAPAGEDVATTVDSLREEIYQLKSQLREREDESTEKAVELARLTSDLSHWKLKATKYSQDVQACEAQQRKSTAEIQNLQRKIDGLTRELQARDSALDLLSEEQSNYQREVSCLKEMISDRDQTIRDLLERNHDKESTALDTLKQELMRLDAENRELTDSGLQLRQQLQEAQATVDRLTERLQRDGSRSQRLEQQLCQMEEEVKSREEHVMKARQQEVDELQTRLHRLRDEHSVERSSLQVELDSLKRQLSEATRPKPAPLHAISLLTDTTVRSDASSCSESDSNQVSSELRVTQKQLDAVRLENKYLKEQIVFSAKMKSDSKATETHLADSQPSRDGGAIVHSLHAENQKLKSDMARLREELMRTQEIYHAKYQSVLREMLNDIRRREERLTEGLAHAESAKHTVTPGTAESGYRSQLNAPSTGKERATPADSAASGGGSPAGQPEAAEELRREARKCQQLIEEEASLSMRSRDTSYGEGLTANSTCLDDRCSLPHGQSVFDYAVEALNRPSTPEKSFLSEYLPLPSPAGSVRSTSTRKSASSCRAHSHRSGSARSDRSGRKSDASERGSEPPRSTSCHRADSRASAPGRAYGSPGSESARSSSSAGSTSRPSTATRSTQRRRSSRHSLSSVEGANQTAASQSRAAANDDTLTSDSTLEQSTISQEPSLANRSVAPSDGGRVTAADQVSLNQYYASSVASEAASSLNESIIGLLDNSNIASRAASAAEKFLEDQRRRTSDLERLLDGHIRTFGGSTPSGNSTAHSVANGNSNNSTNNTTTATS